MGEILTLAEIYSRFDAEWVLLDEPQTTEDLEIQSGKVLAHSKDRDEVYRKAIELRPKRCAFLFTGSMPEDTEIVL
jgi:DNA replicative helicase MCM subunit Mcm2 (Cdc46/Mcm family)